MARPTLFTHPKFRRLVFLLNEPVPHVLGYLECIWHVAYESGEPIIGDAVDVELAAQWSGERGRLCAALVASRLLDEVESGRYAVHDLWQHAPDYVRKRRDREAGRKRKYEPRKRPMTADWRDDVDELGAQRRTTADNGGQVAPNSRIRRTTADSDRTTADSDRSAGELGSPPAPAPLHSLSENVAPSTPSEASELPPVMTLPCLGGKKGKPTEWPLSEAKLAEYREAYPGVDVLGEIRRAKQWLTDNPSRRKTYDGIPAFLVRWLTKAQNGPTPGRQAPEPPAGPTTDEIIAEQIRRRREFEERRAQLRNDNGESHGD